MGNLLCTCGRERSNSDDKTDKKGANKREALITYIEN